MSDSRYKSGKIADIHVRIIASRFQLICILWGVLLNILGIHFVIFFTVYQRMYDLDYQFSIDLMKGFRFHVYLEISFLCRLGICTYLHSF